MKTRVTYPKYETCDLMHNGVCVSTPCICKGIASKKKKLDLIEKAFIAGRSQTSWKQFKKDNNLDND